MKFRTPHDLLVYLAELSDSDQSSALYSGGSLIDMVLAEGMIEWVEHDLDRLAQFAFALRDEGAIWLNDMAGHRRHPNATIRFNDLSQASDIRVMSAGRLAVQASRPHVTIGQLAIGGDIANIDLTVLIAELERRVEEMPANDEAKEEAQTALRRVREAAENVGTSAAGDLIGAALRQVLGLG